MVSPFVPRIPQAFSSDIRWYEVDIYKNHARAYPNEVQHGWTSHLKNDRLLASQICVSGWAVGAGDADGSLRAVHLLKNLKHLTIDTSSMCSNSFQHAFNPSKCRSAPWWHLKVIQLDHWKNVAMVHSGDCIWRTLPTITFQVVSWVLCSLYCFIKYDRVWFISYILYDYKHIFG